MTIFLALLGFLSAILGFFVPRIVLGCVYEAERKRQLPTQFRMTDLMWLTLLVQLLLALVAQLYAGEQNVIQILAIFVLVAVPLVWWHCLRVLSRAGVLGFWLRGLFLVVIVPLTFATTIAAVICGGIVPFVVDAICLSSATLGSSPFEEGWLVKLLGIYAAVVLLTYALRRAARYVIDSGADVEVEVE